MYGVADGGDGGGGGGVEDGGGRSLGAFRPSWKVGGGGRNASAWKRPGSDVALRPQWHTARFVLGWRTAWGHFKELSVFLPLGSQTLVATLESRLQSTEAIAHVEHRLQTLGMKRCAQWRELCVTVRSVHYTMAARSSDLGEPRSALATGSPLIK